MSFTTKPKPRYCTRCERQLPHRAKHKTVCATCTKAGQGKQDTWRWITLVRRERGVK